MHSPPPRPAPVVRALVLCLALTSGCGGDSAPAPGATRLRGAFEDATAELGIRFELERPAPGDYFMPDIMGGGCAFLDYDGDGDLDVYGVAGYRDAAGALETERGANRLYRQEADGRFVDVTLESGAGDRGYGLGVAVGDVDNDGFPDLFLSNYGSDRLLHNQGDGTFRDVTEAAGVAGEGWSTACGFFDHDGDGLLDLFVVRYVDYDPAVGDVDAAGQPEYPAPAAFPHLSDRLFHNEGGLRFTDVSSEVGIADSPGRGLGLAITDLDGDGREDLYVANDGEENFAWIQREDGSFEDRAGALGLAVNVFGATEASMGVACADYDGDGRDDLFLTHLDEETNTLYQRLPTGGFRDKTVATGLAAGSHDYTGFGTSFLDHDLDGDLDILVVNGRVLRKELHPRAALSAHWARYAQPNLLFEGDGAGRFVAVGEACGALCGDVEVSRGLALGDVDADGDLDALVSNGNGTLRLYRNEAAREGGWLIVRALDPALGRDAYGAVVEVTTAAGVQRRRIQPAGSYLSSSDPRAHFGLGGAERVERVRIHWPGGPVEEFDGGPANRLLVLERGAR